LASDLGLDVTLIDPKPNTGGVCLFHGCIPSKALLHVVKVIDEARQASRWGVEFSDPKINLGKLRSWKDSVVGKLTGGLGEVSKRRRVRYLQGHARFP
jgi:dihydrolipoamide dehydrogenase